MSTSDWRLNNDRTPPPSQPPLSRTTDPPIAILASDLHLDHRRPACRADDWYLVQRRYLRQLHEASPSWDVPLIVAGDITDRPSQPAEFVNFLLDYLPEMYAIPGQHDLPLHNYEDMGKSVFGILVKVGRIRLLNPRQPTAIPIGDNPYGLWLHAFPWGFKVKPLAKKVKDAQWLDHQKDAIHLAVIHKYIWTEKTKHPGANKDQQLWCYRDKLEGYTAAVFGDNHRHFLHNLTIKDETCSVLNCGSFMRRKRDELDYQPKIGLLHKSGKITRQPLDTSKDRFLEIAEPLEALAEAEEIQGFIEELNRLGDKGLNFQEAVRLYLESNDLAKGTKKAILKALEP